MGFNGHIINIYGHIKNGSKTLGLKILNFKIWRINFKITWFSQKKKILKNYLKILFWDKSYLKFKSVLFCILSRKELGEKKN